MKKINLIFLLFLIPLISASNLNCALNPTYYQNGVSIVPTSDTHFSGISFSISCSSTAMSRILQVSVINSTPIELTYALDHSIKDYLTIMSPSVVLWNSNVMNTNDFSNSTNFSVNIIGFNEKNISLETSEASYIVTINNQEDFVISMGKWILPSNPDLGFCIEAGILIVIIYFIWEKDIFKKVEAFKKRRKIKQMERKYYG